MEYYPKFRKFLADTNSSGIVKAGNAGSIEFFSDFGYDIIKR